MITKIKNSILKHYLISGTVLVVIIFLGFKLFAGGSNNNQIVVVTKGPISQTISVTGKVKPSHDASLAFEKSGKVVESNVDIGSRVFAGQVLVRLDSSGPYADYLKAQANVEAEKANLEQLKKGTRPEEIAVYQTQLDNAKSEMLRVMNDAYAKSDDAIHNNIDQLFSNPRSSTPQINIYSNDSQLKNDVNQSKFIVENILSTWSNINVSTDSSIIKTVSSNLNTVKAFVDKISIIVNSLTANSTMTQITVDAYKASISLARTNLQTASQKLTDAESTLILAEKNLALKQVGNTTEAIQIQEAKVLQSEAQVKFSESELAKLTLKSPISGVVTKQSAKLGEIVTSGLSIITVISDSNLQIEADISEINIGKVGVGNTVNITMDAFPGKIFKGSVTYIEPAETVIDGVVNFKVTIIFTEKYPEIKTGLTANLEIVTESKENVLSVPKYAITIKDSKQYVMKIQGKENILTEITIGITGNDGKVEVLSGLSEGDSILLITTK